MNTKEHDKSNRDNRGNRSDVLLENLTAKISQINKQIVIPGTEVDAAIATDLAEIYISLEKYQEAIDKFLTADIQNREVMEAALVEIESTLKHIESHCKNAHALFERMKTYYCWK